MIKFNNIQDVKLLYGGKFYLMNNSNEKNILSAVKSDDNSGSLNSKVPFLNFESIDWKIKKGAVISLIISKADFYDKSKTNYLKLIIEESNVPTTLFSFGIYSDNCDWASLGSMPTPYGIIFSSKFNLPDLPQNLAVVPDIVDTGSFKELFLITIQKIKDNL